MDGLYYDDNVAGGANKRDKRRQTMASRLDQLSELFDRDRDYHYGEMLRKLQSTLYSLHVGDNGDFLENVADAEEARDEQLMMLYLWEQYQLERSEAEYALEIETANEEHQHMTDLVKDKLMSRLEAQRKKLGEDKALLDIANDQGFFLTGANGGYASNGYAFRGGDANGGSHPASYPPGSPGGATSQSGLERRSLRRRGLHGGYDDFSGLSGNEGSATGLGISGIARRSAGQPSGYRTNGGSDADALSDRDLEGVLFSKDRDAPTTRHTSKAYHGVRILKPDEAMEDIMLLRAAIRRGH